MCASSRASSCWAWCRKNTALSTLVASNVFSAVFTERDATDLISNALLQIPLPDFDKLALVMVPVFVLGWRFECPAIILVFLPIVLPVVQQLYLGLDRQETTI